MCTLARAEEEHEGANVEEGIEAAGHGEARVPALSRACACARACMCMCACARACVCVCVHGARVAVLREHGAAHDAGEDAQGDAAQAAVPWRHAAAPGSIGRVAAAAGCRGLQRLIRCRRMGGLHAHAQHVHVHVTCGCRLSAARGRRSTGPSSSSWPPSPLSSRSASRAAPRVPRPPHAQQRP